MTYPLASCDTMTAFQMSVIWLLVSILICQPVTSLVPSFSSVTLPLKPPDQEFAIANTASTSPELAGGVGVGVVGVVGAVSSLTMVPVPVAREMVAPTALVSTTPKCSLPSTSLSEVISIVIVLLCSPTAKVTWPLLAMKSAAPASP